jgi:hypothetical protein
MPWAQKSLYQMPHLTQRTALLLYGYLPKVLLIIGDACAKNRQGCSWHHWFGSRKTASFLSPKRLSFCDTVEFLTADPEVPGFDSRRYHIFWEAVGLVRGPLSPCESKWGATWKKSSGSGLENRLTTVGDPPRWPRDTPLSTKVGTKFRQHVAVAQSV